MKIILGIIQHAALVSVLLMIFTRNYIKIKHSAESDFIKRIITNLTINLAIFTLINYMLSFIGIKTIHIYFGMIIVVISITVFNFFRVNLVEYFLRLNSNMKPTILIIGSVLLISIWQYLPTLTLLNSTASSLNMTSIGNNDIANYALAAKEYLNSGFNNSGRYPDVDFNSYARDLQHLTVHLIISFTSFVSNLPVWKIMNSVMIFTIALNAIALMKLFNSMSNKKSFLLAFLASSIALLNPLNSYVIQHYFLSQSLSLFILTLIILKAYEIFNKSRTNLIDKIEIVSIVILSIFSYPSILIPAILGVLLLNILNEKFLKKKEFKHIVQKYLALILVGALGIGLSFVYLPRALNILFLHATITSGWNLPAPNAIGIFFAPYYISNGINNSLTFLIWISLLILIIKVLYINFDAKRVNNFYLILICSIIFAFMIQVIIRGHGFGYYQNWKLLSYVLPVIIIFVIAETSKLNNKTIFFLLPFIMGGLNAPISLWKDGNEFGANLVISNDLSELRLIKEKFGIESLNVMIEPYYQTMAVGLVTDISKIYFSSPTYYPLNFDENSCSLIKSSDANYSNKIQINKSYSLISSKNLRCDVASADSIFMARDNVEYKLDDMNLKNRALLDRGWSYPEKWGTWSEGDFSRIRFKLPVGHRNVGTLIIKSTFFVTEKNDNSQMEVVLNGINLGNYYADKNRSLLEFEVNNLKEGNNTLDFKYSNIISPNELKISDDKRLIYLGISSFKIIEQR